MKAAFVLCSIAVFLISLSRGDAADVNFREIRFVCSPGDQPACAQIPDVDPPPAPAPSTQPFNPNDPCQYLISGAT